MLVCCGLVTLDVVQVVDAVPGPNQKVVADGLDVRFGGPAANAAATAVALGVRTRLVTAIGSGPVADLVRGGLRDAGVEVVDLAAGTAATPPVSTVLVTRGTGERAVVSVNGAGTPDLTVAVGAALAGGVPHAAGARPGDAAVRPSDPVPGGPGVLAGATAVLVDGHHLGAAVPLAAAAHAAGVPVALDGGSWKPGLGDLLAHVDHAVVSADFRLPDVPGPAHDVKAAATAPEAGRPAGPDPDALLAAVLARWPVRSAARSAGGGPLRYVERGGEVREVPVEEVPAAEVVDTLGAGDVLHGALAASLARGAGVAEALAEGVRVATRSVRYPGALGWAEERGGDRLTRTDTAEGAARTRTSGV
ncbi:carbohydrate kinase [Cellulomonas triticagri]|uniref:Carbohydrate kinase n=1 Tax=Cellulomonas triticagri TaxID=2483352 RepID=A0A3M2JTZ1_9CELL|nr:carbohydrate kinase [Cellulomonas triticagri]